MVSQTNRKQCCKVVKLIGVIVFKIVVPYKDREKSAIVVAHLEEPYGKGSKPVVSVGCTLKGDTDDPTWKVHVPADILPDVILAMREVSDSAWRESAE